MDQDHEEDETELENFLENDDVESLQRCIAVGYSVDFILPTVSSNRPELLKSKLPIISFAAFYKSEECVRFLLQNGALINIPDKKGVSLFF
ncbi:hypothetical protein TRFO_04039 [Tritrichomonas foetus]|uniref:Ankyrin repeat protein n=1 Tax=Tritrichomonas foetus TaxID=1144522 RepID=A0A1J4KN19_9EUKA|nr:hypothetical protein TRFO_04039 [Tritrichomonas foetus]|eukprot:OHT11094.1 hypothetical protein TRFO_04039 [Tritrichomonas foetus]